jgi:hypothetical protein
MKPEHFHFRIEELVDPDTLSKYGEDVCWEFFPDSSIDMLRGIRDFFDVPITINNWVFGGSFRFRGYRPPSCKIGAAHSYHRSGRAFDFDVKGLTAAQARKMILDNNDDQRLKGIWRMEDGVSWVHVDSGNPPDGKDRIYLFKG